MAGTGAPAASLDTSVPKAARMYDYWSGGKDNFGDMTLVEPGLTDVWVWRPDAATVVAGSDVMTVVGGVGRKEPR